MRHQTISLTLFVLLFFMSCNKTQFKNEQEINYSSININKEGFDSFKSKFKPLEIEELSDLWSYLNNYIIATDNSYKEVAKKQ